MMHATVRMPYEITDADLLRIAADNPGWQVELIDGAVVVSPTSSDAGRRNARLTAMLVNWADEHGYEGFDSSTGFRLDRNTVLSPDGALLRREKWSSLSNTQRSTFAQTLPDAVVELVSDSDSRPQVREKCDRWHRAGVPFVIMLDPSTRQSSTWGTPLERFPTDWSAVLE